MSELLHIYFCVLLVLRIIGLIPCYFSDNSDVITGYNHNVSADADTSSGHPSNIIAVIVTRVAVDETWR